MPLEYFIPRGNFLGNTPHSRSIRKAKQEESRKRWSETRGAKGKSPGRKFGVFGTRVNQGNSERGISNPQRSAQEVLLPLQER